MACSDAIVVDQHVGWRIKRGRDNQQPGFLRLGLGVGVGGGANWADETTDPAGRSHRCFFGLDVGEKINAKDGS